MWQTAWLFFDAHGGQAMAAVTLGCLAWVTTDGEKQKVLKEFWLFLVALPGAIVGPGAYFWMPWVTDHVALAVARGRAGGQAPTAAQISAAVAQIEQATRWPYVAWCLYGAAGLVTWWVLYRFIPKQLNRFKAWRTIQSKTAREGQTDIRNVKDLFPKPVPGRHGLDANGLYDPRVFFRKDMIFSGLDRDWKPVYLPYKVFQRVHIEAAGMTGSGKGVLVGLYAWQALQHGERVIFIDPKDDEWAPHLLRGAAEAAGVPFYLVDLRSDAPQFNLLEGADAKEIEEVMVAGFSLGDIGGPVDYYRVKARNRAKRLAEAIHAGNPRLTMADLAEAARADKEMVTNAETLVERLEEAANVTAINAVSGGLSLPDLIEKGGALYVIGSSRLGRVITVQRMLLVRLMQLVERRDRMQAAQLPRVFLFLDELKHLMSKPAVDALGMIRDKGAHLALAHQSKGDLREVPQDLDKDAVVGAVVENVGLRGIYKLNDSETAEWLAANSGKILVDEELRHFERSGALVEEDTGKRTLRQAPRFLLDENMWLGMPEKTAAIVAPGLITWAYICPVPVEKRALSLVQGTPWTPSHKPKPAKPETTKKTTAPAAQAVHPLDAPPADSYEEAIPDDFDL